MSGNLGLYMSLSLSIPFQFNGLYWHEIAKVHIAKATVELLKYLYPYKSQAYTYLFIHTYIYT